MKFNIEKVILWLKNGKRRELEFKPNKINVITGESNTGKTAIMKIIDYCLFSSDPKIAQSIIGENVLWYGIRININDKVYTIARKNLIKGKPSDKYYFSSIGEIPSNIYVNNAEKLIKLSIEKEFSINRSVTFEYGGNNLKAGSKISFRYFLLFNTISVEIIENENIFFDKQHESTYKEALPRIFNIATGIENIENSLRIDKKKILEKKLKQKHKQYVDLLKKQVLFYGETSELISKARSFNLIGMETDNSEAMNELERVVKNFSVKTDDSNVREMLEKQKGIIARKITNMKTFNYEYSLFKINLIKVEDSLKPIQYIKESLNVIKGSIFNELINQLSEELLEVKEGRKLKTPLDIQIFDEILKLEGKIEEIDTRLKSLPKEKNTFNNDREKYLFIGEIKGKLEAYSDTEKASYVKKLEDEMEEIEEKINLIQIDNTEQERELVIKYIEDFIRKYILVTESALGNYKDFLPVFDYTFKKLSLRNSKTIYIEDVGSSSNHMFLQLFFSLSLHEVALIQVSPFIAQFLIIDQPSRPYYGTDGKKKKDDNSDDYKIEKAFALLDYFIEERIKNNQDFQMIVFEHVPANLIQDFKNVHIVEEFIDGNALIPLDMID